MEDTMLEQIQQMITTATEMLRRDIVGSLDQKVDGLSTSLRAEMIGMRGEFRQEMTGMKDELRQDMAAMESRLGERINETKRHSGILVEDLQHKLVLVIGGQQFLRQDIANVRSDTDAQTGETRILMATAYRDLDQRMRNLEQS